MYNGRGTNMKVTNENQAHCWCFIKPRTMRRQSVCTISLFSRYLNSFLIVGRVVNRYRKKKKGKEKNLQRQQIPAQYTFYTTINITHLIGRYVNCLARSEQSKCLSCVFFFVCLFTLRHFFIQPYLREPAADGQQSRHRDQRNTTTATTR